MALDPDPYEVLGVPRDAGEDQITRARRQLSRAYHPDLNPAPDAAARFDEVQRAYQRLTGPRPPDERARDEPARDERAPGERGGTRVTRDFAPRPRAGPEGSGPALPDHLKPWLLVIVLALIFLVYLVFTAR